LPLGYLPIGFKAPIELLVRSAANVGGFVLPFANARHVHELPHLVLDPRRRSRYRASARVEHG